jgi:cell division septation protein DedD
VTQVEPLPPETDAEEADHEYHGNGESPDRSALKALHLAHRAVAKFPDLTRRYQKFIGTAAVVSSALIVLSSIAVSRRIHRGESDEKILAEITPDEIENASQDAPKKPQNGNKGQSRTH